MPDADPFWPPLLAKALATALTVVLAGLAAVALGPIWGAVIASLPVSAGPAYAFLAAQHGPGFVAAAVLHSAAANAATGLFLLAYARLGARWRPAWRGLAAALGVWLAACLAIRWAAAGWTPSMVVGLNLAVYAGAMALLARGGAAAPPAAPPVRAARPRWFDLPVRAAGIAGFVAVLVALSARLGPEATGLAAVFPISLSGAIVVLRPRLGGPATARMAADALAPMLGFGLMLVALHLAIPRWGAAPSLGLGLAWCVLWSGALLAWKARRRRGPGPAAPSSADWR